MDTPPDEITTSQDSKASDKNDLRYALLSLRTSCIKTSPPAFPTRSEKT